MQKKLNKTKINPVKRTLMICIASAPPPQEYCGRKAAQAMGIRMKEMIRME